MISINRLALGAAVLFVGCVIARASGSGAFDRVIPLSSPASLDIRSDIGGIIVRAGSASLVRVHAVIKPVFGAADLGVSSANIRAREERPPVEKVGNKIRIGFVDNPAALRGVSMRLEIEAPRTAQIQAETTSGGIRIQGIDGAVVARSKSGSLQLLDIGGTIQCETSSGRTEISDVSGSVHSATHSGGISIDNATGPVNALNASGRIEVFQLSGPVRAHTTSGAIRISQIRPAPVNAHAESGSIKVELADSRGYNIDAQSKSGKVSGPVTIGPGHISETHSLKGQIGVGGPLIDLDTRSSAIEVD